jgi:hypothetical protein
VNAELVRPELAPDPANRSASGGGVYDVAPLVPGLLVHGTCLRRPAITLPVPVSGWRRRQTAGGVVRQPAGDDAGRLWAPVGRGREGREAKRAISLPLTDDDGIEHRGAAPGNLDLRLDRNPGSLIWVEPAGSSIVPSGE